MLRMSEGGDVVALAVKSRYFATASNGSNQAVRVCDF